VAHKAVFIGVWGCLVVWTVGVEFRNGDKEPSGRLYVRIRITSSGAMGSKENGMGQRMFRCTVVLDIWSRDD